MRKYQEKNSTCITMRMSNIVIKECTDSMLFLQFMHTGKMVVGIVSLLCFSSTI